MSGYEYISEQKIKVGENAAGEAIEVTKLVIKGGDSAAKKVYIQASMHASEIQGNAVILVLLKYFKNKQPLGDITIIPQCNPIGRDMLIGAGHQGRFDSTNGDNWNRYYFKPDINYHDFAKTHLKSDMKVYKQALREVLYQQIDQALANQYMLSRAKRLNYTMQKHALEADIILDLHTDTHSIDYLYSPAYAKNSAEKFGFEHVFLIENKCNGALDEAGFYPWWSLQRAFGELGRKEVVGVESFTLELGSEELINSQKAQMQALRILNYLAHHKVVQPYSDSSNALSSRVTFHNEDNFKALHALYGGLYEWFIAPGDVIKKDQLVGRCLKMSSQTAISISFPFNGLVISINAKGALQQGSHLLNVVL
ncbi:succinylglutamate desuccinylase/aspartoacylase domain-containing protein [Fastidiosibacter lacustris]|uniref:succinylglutamate desuccinylase/aspartoacylase domain-containing protein n=1 Tax=Fastidiosibacter lacustris TaxID=2056695 RepID=UPI000E3440E3|nr:succinylglutamate desuccinylase/aspartoacylase family protein [Fastidiosibacter lacustris]